MNSEWLVVWVVLGLSIALFIGWAVVVYLVTGNLECLLVHCVASPDGSGITVIEK